ncbi:MAG: site-specific integrase, partial [Bacteroidales bacterium]|nr:site-specific integrase [Bacteroidales bacterium]
MARAKFYFDNRPTRDGRYHIKLSLSHKGTSALMPTGVFIKPEQWNSGDGETDPHIKKTCTGYKALNSIISEKLHTVQQYINTLVLDGTINSYTTATQIKNYVQNQITGKNDNRGLVAEHFKSFIERCNRQGTASVYRETLTKIAKYHDINSLKFEDITIAWLKNFESLLRKDGLAVNSTAIHLRNIRAVYNDAIDYNIISMASYPFRRFKIIHEKTAKRALTLAQLRQLRDYPCEPAQEKYRDLFMLIFYLGGINIVDLLQIKEVVNGRIEYRRAKTSVLYSIKVEPEAQAIIDKYRGVNQLLFTMDRYVNYKDFLHRMNSNLRNIGTYEMVANSARNPNHVRKNKKSITPLFPGLTTYW